jgi:hypothetical protein
MKRSILLFLPMMLCVGLSVVRSQIPYYDAMTLRRFFVYDTTTNAYLSNNDSIIVIYRKYTPGVTDIRVTGTAYNANPFLKQIRYIGSARDFKGLPNIANSLGTSVSNFDITTLADGMAKFLVKRAKEELAITFFNRFKDAIADTNCRDLRTLFPATYATLQAIGDQIYYYDAYIQTLRESFEKDLREISSHLPSLIDNHTDYFSKHPEIESILRSGCYIANALKNEESMGVILRDYSVVYLDKVNPNIKASVQTLRLFSESLRDTAIVTRPNAYWVSAQQVQTLVSDSLALKIYLGLIYQQTKNIPIRFADGVTLTAVLDSVAPEFINYSDGYRRYLTNLAERTSTITELTNKFKSSSNDSLKLEQYFAYISAGVDLLASASDVGMLGLKDAPISKAHQFFEHADDSLSAYMTTVRSAANIVWDVKRRSYASAIVNAASIYNVTFPNDSRQIGRQLLKYGTFMATIAQAKTSDDVESAIEAMALPAGSARIKRESCIDISLNAYVGGFYGKETDQSPGAASTSSTIYGMNAPIGVALSTSLNIPYEWFGNSCVKYPLYLLSGPLYLVKSLTVFGSLVDLGAVTAYRARNDTVSNLPTLKLANIIAPGIHFIVGIRDVPISIGYGWQIGPQLRDITSSSANVNNVQGNRWSAFVAVDIPLLDFYTKSSQ